MFSTNNSTIVISRYNEDIEWISKLNNFPDIRLYEKNNIEAKYNVPLNKSNEATVYLKYIIDNYDILPEYMVFLHCCEEPRYINGNIIDIINSKLDKFIGYENLNSYLFNIDYSENFKIYYDTYLEPYIGKYELYSNLTKDIKAFSQFIVNKNRVIKHPKKFYEDIYNWLLETSIDNYLSNRYLEWTWHLFLNKCNIKTLVYVACHDGNKDIAEQFCITNNINPKCLYITHLLKQSKYFENEFFFWYANNNINNKEYSHIAFIVPHFIHHTKETNLLNISENMNDELYHPLIHGVDTLSYHPHLRIIFCKTIEHLGYGNFDELITTRSFNVNYRNYWVMETNTLYKFAKVICKVRDYFETDNIIKPLLMQNANHGSLLPKEKLLEMCGVPYYPHHTFVMERLHNIIIKNIT